MFAFSSPRNVGLWNPSIEFTDYFGVVSTIEVLILSIFSGSWCSALSTRSFPSSRSLLHKKGRKGVVKSFLLFDLSYTFLVMIEWNYNRLFLFNCSRKLQSLEVRFLPVSSSFRPRRSIWCNSDICLFKLDDPFCFEVQALKKTFKKLDHDVNVQDFLGARSVVVTPKFVCWLILLQQISKLSPPFPFSLAAHKQLRYKIFH